MPPRRASANYLVELRWSFGTAHSLPDHRRATSRSTRGPASLASIYKLPSADSSVGSRKSGTASWHAGDAVVGSERGATAGGDVKCKKKRKEMQQEQQEQQPSFVMKRVWIVTWIDDMNEGTQAQKVFDNREDAWLFGLHHEYVLDIEKIWVKHVRATPPPSPVSPP